MYIYIAYLLYPFLCYGHLGYVHVLAIVNSAAINLGVHIFSELWFLLDICLGVELQDHMVALFLVFSGTSILFSAVVVPIYIPTNSVGGFPFPYTLSRIYCLWAF